MSESIKLAMVQMQSSDDVQANFSQCRNLIQKVSAMGGADLICFPENTFYLRVDSSSPKESFDLSEPIFKELSLLAKEMKTCFLLGSIPLSKSGQIYNTSVWIDELGDVCGVYDKIHLFDVDVEGQKPMRESDQFVHGEGPSIIKFKDWSLGLSICYDLRFAELYQYYGAKEVDLILVPSAFLVPTGRAHWHTLLRARAIENQCYVVAPAQVGPNRGTSGGERMTYGHSLAVDPWGVVITEIEASEQGVAFVELNKGRILKARQQIPMANHRRFKSK